MTSSLALRSRRLEVRAGHAPLPGAKLSLAIVGSFLAFALFGAAPARAADLSGAFDGNAYGTYANAKAGALAATLARSAFQGCPCNGTNGKILTSETDAISFPGILTANKTISTAFTSKTHKTAQVQNTASVQNLNALGGLITADGITAVATVSATKHTITPSSEGSGFNNLTVAGQKIPADVPPNTTLPLPGIGSVTLNKVTTGGRFKKSGQILVEMIAIDVKSGNGLGLPIGAKLVIAHALAGYTRKEPDAVYNGTTFVAEATGNVGNDLKNKIGRAAAINIDCQGTGGKTLTNSVGDVNVNGLVGLSGGYSTAFAGSEGDAFVSRTASTATGLSLLGGLIQADGLQAVAQSTLKNGVATGSAAGSGFNGLKVAGVSIPLNLPPNTSIPLPGLGTVTINEQTVDSDGSVSANGLHITVSSFNLLGLPVGSELLVAHATSSVAPF